MQTWFSALLTRFQTRHRQRVYIIPTRYGMILVLFLFVMFLGAVNYSNSMGHLLVFLLVSVAHTAMLYTHRNIRHLKLQHIHAAPTFCGESAQFNVTVENTGTQAVHQILLSTRPDEPTKWRFFSFIRGFLPNARIPHIAALENQRAELNILTTQRGYQSLGTVKLSTQFPLGLFNSWMQIATEAKVLVYPKPVGDLPLPTQIDEGQRYQPSMEKGLDDFAGLQKYRVGDPVHRIAWKKSVKSPELQTKQFSGQQSGKLTLNWGDTQGDVETRLSQLCQWLLRCEQHGIATRLHLPNQSVPFGQGKPHLTQCLTALALFNHG
jgi:uncharacterized protein (DUF58 family)